jgi:hypothetical protein
MYHLLRQNYVRGISLLTLIFLASTILERSVLAGENH